MRDNRHLSNLELWLAIFLPVFYLMLGILYFVYNHWIMGVVCILFSLYWLWVETHIFSAIMNKFK